MPETFVDNDVVLKLCQFGCLADLVRCLCGNGSNIFVLGSLRFKIGPMVASDVGRRKTLDTFLGEVSEAEPTDADILLAAQMEEIAQRVGHAVDEGESLLFAMAIARAAWVATGDKRAVEGLAAIAGDMPICTTLAGQILTMEWLANALILHRGVNEIRQVVCAAPKVDRALGICFQCTRDRCTYEDVHTALTSYQSNLARRTGGFVEAILPSTI